MAKQNRAQRRLDRFGGGRNAQHGGWPERRPNPVFGEPPRPDEATSGGPDQAATAESSPGSGGAIEPAGPAPSPEGSDPANSAKG